MMTARRVTTNPVMKGRSDSDVRLNWLDVCSATGSGVSVRSDTMLSCKLPLVSGTGCHA